MKKRTVKFLALLTVSAIFLSSCSNKVPSVSEPAESTTAAEETTVPVTEKVPETIIIHGGDPDNKVYAEAYLKALPDKDFNGASFIITAPDTSLFDPSEIRYLSKAVSERNIAVEEKFKVTVSNAKSDIGKMLEDSKKNAAAEMFYSHVMAIPMKNTPDFSVYDLLMNLRSMPLLDLDRPYFNSSSIDALSLGHSTYGLSGEALPLSSGLSVLFFNKNIAEAAGIGDLYATALNGELTWDKVNEFYASASAAGFIPAVTDGGEDIDAVYVSVGEKYVSSGESKIPAVSIANFSMNVAATQYRTIVNGADAAGVTKEDSLNVFREGRVLFTVAKIGELDSLNGSAVKLGMLPMPKANADSTYRHLADGSSEVFTVSAGVTDSAMVSLVLTGLCAASYGVIREEFADYLHASTLPDSRSADVYELITENVYFDLAMAYAPHYPEIDGGTVSLVRQIVSTGDFSSFDTSIDTANKFFSTNYPLK